MQVVCLLVCMTAAALAAPSPQSVVPATGPAEQLYPVIPYSYQYEVQDAETANYQNKAEMKTETGDVYGSYSVLMPDGYIYTTTYNVTGDSGYVSNLVRTLAVLPVQRSAGGADVPAGVEIILPDAEIPAAAAASTA